MIDNIKYSVILPVYNVADCLEKCLNSLLAQSYKNFEIICVNDGSTDNSLDILKEYENKFPHYQIICQENKGLAEARNTGFPYAKGDYICYIDSDDFIEPDFFEAINTKTDSNPDIIIFGAKSYYSKTNKSRNGQYSSKNFKEYFDINKLYSFHPVCWNKVYKKSFLAEKNIDFGNIRISEDQMFFIKTILQTNKIEVLKKDLYIYRKQRGTSLTGKKKKTDFSTIENYMNIEQFIKEIGVSETLKQIILGRNLLKAISRYPKCHEDIKKEYFEKLTNLLNYQNSQSERYWWNYFKLKENSSYWQIKLEYIKSLLQYKISKKDRN